MKIAFDCRMIDHPGIGRYIRNLLSFMMLQEKPESFTLYGDPAKLVFFKSASVKNYSTPIYSIKELLFYPFAGDAQILHVPHFNAPFSKKTRLVVTIHDLMYLRLKESAPLLKRLGARVSILNALRSADRIIAVSENTKKDIVELYPKAVSKIRVIYEAADPFFRKVSDRSVLEKTRFKFDLPRNFILFVGSLKRHKNILRLIQAYSDMQARGIDHALVIVGRSRPDEAEVLETVKKSGAVYLSEIPTDDLLNIYNLATLLVIPSLYEGFGLPVLEAMACGLPVVASKATSLPEVAGDAGLLCDPLDAKDIADKICMLLKDESLRRDLIQKGLARVTRYSWGRTAKETLDVYKELL